MRAAYLADFGLARDVTTGSRLTRTGTTLGTPAYMSPELARGEFGALTPASDVWALGCVLHELLAGRPAFDGSTPAQVVGAVVAGRPPDLAAARPDLPAPLRRVLAACFAARAPARPATAGALRRLLDQVRAGGPVDLPRRMPWRALAAAGAVALLALAGWAARRPRPAPAPAAVAGDPLDALLVEVARVRHDEPGRAVAALHAALARAPGRHDLRLDLGLLAWSIGDFDAAFAAWAAVPRGAPEWPRAQLHAALAHLDRFDTEAASACALALREAPREHAALALGVGMLCLGDARKALEVLHDQPGWEASLLRAIAAVRLRGDLARARREIEAAIAQGPPLAFALAQRGVIRAKLGDAAGALADLDAALARAPGRWPLLHARAPVRLALGHVDGALADAEAVLAVEPDEATALLVRGAVRRRRGDAAGGRSDLERAAAGAPERGDAWQLLAEALEDAGDLDGAIAALDRAVRDPDWTARAHAVRGRVRSRQQDLAGALADFDAALALDPTDVVARFNRALTHRRAGNAEAAVADCTEVLARRPSHAGAWVTRAQLRYDAADLRGALADFESAVAAAPADGDAWASVSALRRELGEVAGALTAGAQATAHAPTLPRAWRALAMARGAAGDPPAAADAWRRYLAVETDAERVADGRARLAACEQAR